MTTIAPDNQNLDLLKEEYNDSSSPAETSDSGAEESSPPRETTHLKLEEQKPKRKRGRPPIYTQAEQKQRHRIRQQLRTMRGLLKRDAHSKTTDTLFNELHRIETLYQGSKTDLIIIQNQLDRLALRVIDDYALESPQCCQKAVRCRGVTKNQRQCKMLVYGQPWCRWHTPETKKKRITLIVTTISLALYQGDDLSQSNTKTLTELTKQ